VQNLIAGRGQEWGQVEQEREKFKKGFLVKK